MKIYKLFSIRLWPSGLSRSVVSWTIEEENSNSKFSALLLWRWWSQFPLKSWQHSTKLHGV